MLQNLYSHSFNWTYSFYFSLYQVPKAMKEATKALEILARLPPQLFSTLYNNFVYTYTFLFIFFFFLLFIMYVINEAFGAYPWQTCFAIHGADLCWYPSFLSSDQSILRIDPCKYHSDSCMIRFVGARPYGTGHMGGAQYTTVSGQVNIAHAPPMVRSIRGTTGSCSGWILSVQYLYHHGILMISIFSYAKLILNISLYDEINWHQN